MLLCGIDASTKVTGMSLFKDDRLLSHYVIDLHKRENADERFSVMMFSICSTLETWTPDIVYVEDTWNKKNIETTKKLSMLIGGIMRQCQIQRIKFKLIYPSQWRSLVGIREGKGIKRQALKESAIELIRGLHSIDVVEDEAEGICIGMAGVMIENGDNLFD